MNILTRCTNTTYRFSIQYICVDKEAPVFGICPDNQTLDTQPGQPFAVALWQDPSATDNSGDVSNTICDPKSGSKFTIGQTLVTCEAVDDSGNNETCNFQIAVEGKRIIPKNKASILV